MCCTSSRIVIKIKGYEEGFMININEVDFADIDGISFVTPFAPVTKKNHGRIVMCGKYPKLLPSEAYERYAKAVVPFLKTNFGTCGTIP